MGRFLGVVMGYDSSSNFTAQHGHLIFLTQNYIGLKLGTFKTRPLDYLG